MKNRSMMMILVTAMFTTLFASATHASTATKQELQARFEQRFPQILESKTQGKVGETTQGMLEAVDPKFLDDQKLARLVADENTDRQELYKIIADETKTTPAKVAERMAQRNFAKARPGEYLKGADGQWKRKS